jgi:hypothetical protein
MEAKANNTIDVDALTAVDGLERSRFTKYLLDVLVQVNAEQGAVVGLEGEWGSGKTWVLQQLEPLAETQASEQRLLFLHFNPWMVSGAHDLVAAMLGQLSKQLAEAGRKSESGEGKKRLSKTVKAIDKYASALSAVKHAAPVLNLIMPGAGIVVGGVAAAAEAVGDVARKVVPALPEATAKKSLPALRDDIRAALIAYGRKIVVVIDDLDRIAPAEVAAMVQAVKAVADFPNVVYMLAYEHETLAHALERALDVNDGRAYLEKIVQIPVRLPPVPPRRMQGYALKRLNTALQSITINETEKADVALAMPIAAALLQTPRDVARICTRLAIVMPVVAGEVNVADVLVAETIQLKVPTFVPWMNRYPGLVTELGITRYDPTIAARQLAQPDEWDVSEGTDERDKRRDELLQQMNALTPVDGALSGPYERALQFLFAATRAWHQAADDSNFRRLQRYRYWCRWQYLCDEQEPLTLKNLQELISDSGLVARNGWLDSPAAFRELCELVCDSRTDLSAASSCEWLQVMLKAAKAFGEETVIDYDFGHGPAAAFLAVLQIDGDSERQASIASAIESGPIAFVGRLLLDLTRGEPGHQMHSGPLVDETRLCQLKIKWYGRVDLTLIPEFSYAVSGDLCPYAFCCWMSELGRSTDDIRHLLAQVINSNGSKLSEVFASLSDRSAHQTFPLHVEWELLPSPSELEQAAQGSISFAQSHSNFCKLIRKRATEFARNTDSSPASP